MDLSHVNKMVNLAKAHGFTVTSTTGGQHNSGSLHARGLAIDVRTRDKSTTEINAFITAAVQHGYRVRDERVRPAGQKVWSGPHLHIEVKTVLKQAATAAGAGLVTAAVFFCSLIS